MLYRTLSIIFFTLVTVCLAQAQSDTSWHWTELANMPDSISNNAVTAASANGQAYVYSFGGIGPGLTYADISQNAYRYNVVLDTWDTLPPLPDTLGKIASAASTVKGMVYVLGGYHVFANNNEVSSDRVHIFNPATNSYEADGSPIPVPIDDHVQAVWRDSLIYVVTGWTTSGHVPNVQIYNPTSNTWLSGTPVPDNTDYKAFGASGTIIGDTIYYLGGARPGLNYPIINELRKGIIDPNDPTNIAWSRQIEFGAAGYRMAATSVNGAALWVGGTDDTYNYDANAYNGNGLLPPLNRLMIYRPETDSLSILDGVFTPVMDLRGIGKIDNGRFIVCGGMKSGATVSNKTYLLQNTDVVSGVGVEPTVKQISIYPNPTSDRLYINSDKPLLSVQVFDMVGRLYLQKATVSQSYELSMAQLPIGTYVVRVVDVEGRVAVGRCTVLR